MAYYLEDKRYIIEYNRQFGLIMADTILVNLLIVKMTAMINVNAVQYKPAY